MNSDILSLSLYNCDMPKSFTSRYQYRREPLTTDEATRLAHACETPEEKLVIFTLLDTGLRVGEFAGLTAKDLDWQTARLRIFHGKGGPYGSRSKARVIPLTPRVRALLEPFFTLHDRLEMTPRTIQRLVKHVATRARITRPCSPHVLRHTFAVTANGKGISLPALQRILGHDHLTTTAIYLNLSPEHVVDEFNAKW
jgi:integrase/recombinase XerD